MKRTPLRRLTPMRRTKFTPKPSTKPQIPAPVRDEVLARSGGWCEIDHQLCNGHAQHLHHILRRSQGGKHEATNLLHLCANAHMMVHENPSLSYEQGWLQRSEGGS